MRQIFLLIAMVYSTFFLFAQEHDYVYQPFSRQCYQIDPDSIFEDIQSLPYNIQKVLFDFQSQRFGYYQDNLFFHSGYFYNLDSIAKNHQEVLSDNRKELWVIPQYDLKYIFKDKSLGISQYWIDIKLDKYGQVLYCNFPNMVHRDLKLISLNQVISLGDSLLLDTEQELKDAAIKVDLIYDKEKEILIWKLCYLRSSGQDQKDYLCYIINAHDNSLIRKEGMIEAWFNNCCCESEPIYIELNDK